jgi:hypothetical protein
MPKRTYSRSTINLINWGLRNLRAGLNPRQPTPPKREPTLKEQWERGDKKFTDAERGCVSPMDGRAK